jgi:hypothetical protein
MDVDKIFGLFDDSWKTNDRASELENFKASSIFNVKMFIKLIKNGKGFKNSIIDIFSKSNTTFNLDQIDEAGDHLMYTRAYFWIENVDIEDNEYVSFIDLELFKKYLILSLKHFENMEEYEKCAHLNRFLLKFKRSLDN